ncbi:MAG: peptide MFS transporter [Saprospiraceae bacterium]|nr:peptide MFS transporter [Saprospiraceae bacterium]
MNPIYSTMLLAWGFVLAWVFFVILTNKKVHPKALFALFMVELWERFSYYGMRAFLILYITAEVVRGGLGIADAEAYGIYAAYGALVYLTPIIGGFFADRMMGFRKAIIWGSILMAGGQFVLAVDHPTLFYVGLAFLVIGNGFFKPNISSMVGKFYTDGDPRRDGAFTIFYMGINMGAFLAPLTCGVIAETVGWSYGFLAAGIGMLIGLAVFIWAQKANIFEQYGLKPEEASTSKIAGLSPTLFPYVISILLVPVLWLLIRQYDIMDYLLLIVGGGIIGYLLYHSFEYEKVQRQRIWVVVILLLFTTIFWTFFELAGSALSLFTERNVDKTLFGMELTTSSFQSANPLFIMLFAPVFSWIWIKLARANREPAAPLKFAFGLLMLGAGFMVLNLGTASAVGGMVAAIFLVLLYLMHTLGELALSPVGLSMVTKLAPVKIVAFMMGIWFLSSSIAHQAGKFIAKYTAVEAGENVTTEETLQASMAVFNNVGLFALGAGVLLILLSPMITKWMHGIK